MVKYNFDAKILGSILVIGVIILFFFAINKLIETNRIRESFTIPTFANTKDCKEYKDYYNSCYTFLQTIDNGGLEQTPIVQKCEDICRNEQYLKNLPYRDTPP